MIKISLIFFLVILDNFIKQLIFYNIKLNNFIEINFFFDLAHIHNFGISFGFLSGKFSPWVFIFIGCIILLLIIFMLIESKNNVEKWGLTIIIAGAISNIVDRIINGFVIDFIYLHYKDFYWPAFNFADIYISIGVIILLSQLLIELTKRIAR